MFIRRSLSKGMYSVNRSIKLWFLWWLFNFVAAVAIVIPVTAGLHNMYSKSLIAEQLDKDLAFRWFAEFLLVNKSQIGSYSIQLMIVVGVYLVVALFLIGGSLPFFREWDHVDSFSEEDPLPPEKYFFENAGWYFWRMFRLLLFSLLWYGGFLFLYFKNIAPYFDEMVKGSIQELPVAQIAWIKFLILSSGIVLLKIWFDSAKVRIVAEDARSVFVTSFKALWYLLRNPLSVFGMALMMLLLSVGLTALFQLGLSFIPRNNILMVLAVFGVTQVLIFVRIWLRLVYYAAHMKLFLGYKFGWPAPAGPYGGYGEAGDDMPYPPPGGYNRHTAQPVEEIKYENQP